MPPHWNAERRARSDLSALPRPKARRIDSRFLGVPLPFIFLLFGPDRDGAGLTSRIYLTRSSSESEIREELPYDSGSYAPRERISIASLPPGQRNRRCRCQQQSGPPLHDVVGRKGEATRDLKSVEELQAKFLAKAKAAKAGTMRAKILTQIDDLQRVYAQTAWVQRYYCTQFRFWRFCPFPPCRRACACKGDADACLKRSVDQVPRHEVLQTREKLLEATPLHFAAVERKVRQTWPTEFWPRPVDRELVEGACRGRETTPT